MNGLEPLEFVTECGRCVGTGAEPLPARYVISGSANHSSVIHIARCFTAGWVHVLCRGSSDRLRLPVWLTDPNESDRRFCATCAKLAPLDWEQETLAVKAEEVHRLRLTVAQRRILCEIAARRPLVLTGSACSGPAGAGVLASMSRRHLIVPDPSRRGGWIATDLGHHALAADVRA